MIRATNNNELQEQEVESIPLRILLSIESTTPENAIKTYNNERSHRTISSDLPYELLDSATQSDEIVLLRVMRECYSE